MSEDLRVCGECNKPKIPRGMDWPLWKDGRPVCVSCQVKASPIPETLPACPNCGKVATLEKFGALRDGGVDYTYFVECGSEGGCHYNAGESPMREAAIRAHMLHCQRLAMLVPVQPEGWKLVPRQGVTLEMQRAYFKVIDENMPRLQDHRDSFGRHDANRLAYSAMIEAAPEWVPTRKED